MASQVLVKGQLWAAMITLVIAEVVASLEGSMIYSALPTISREFGDYASASWLITAYTLVSAASAAIGGRLGDIFGRRNILVAILAICAAGSLLSALSDNLVLIIIGRGVQGVTGAILPLAFGIARTITPKKDGPTWIGFLTGAWAASAALGFVLGGMFADGGAWRSLFWITAIAPAIVIVGIYLFIPRDTQATKPAVVDIWGGALFVPAILGLLMGINAANAKGLASPLALGLLIGGAILLAIWVVYEARHPSPLINVKLLANRQVATANLLFALLGVGGFQLAFILMPMLQQPVWTGVGLGISATLAGVLKLPSNLVSGLAGPTSGYIASRWDARAAAIAGSLCSVVAWLGLTFFHYTLWQIVLGTIVAGFGSAMVMAAIPNLILEVTPEDRSSEATGLSLVVRGIFASIGTQVIAHILALSEVAGSGHTVYPTEQGYVAALLFIVGASVLATAAAVTLPRRQSRARTEPAPPAR